MHSDPKSHWEAVYRIRAPDAVNWYRPHLERPLALLERAAPDLSASIFADAQCDNRNPAAMHTDGGVGKLNVRLFIA